MRPPRFSPPPLPLALALFVVLGGCMPLPIPGWLKPGEEETFLRAGPIEPTRRAPPPRSHTPSAAPLPAGLGAEGGLTRLPDAVIPGVGPVDALVVSVSLGAQRPVRTEREIAQGVFGAEPSRAPPATVAGALHAASGGALRLRAAVLPTLVHTRARPEAVLAPRSVERIAREAVAAWAADTALVRWDNDGPDGLPGSEDDDGRLDLVYLALESDRYFAPRVIREPFTVRSAGVRLRVDRVHVLPIPRRGELEPTPALRLTLAALGLTTSPGALPSPMSGAPAGDANEDGAVVSALARVRLGWLPLHRIESREVAIREGAAYVAPLERLGGEGFWLLERREGWIRAARVVRRPGGEYLTTRTEVWFAGAERLLPLDRQLGPRGPVLRVVARDGVPHATRLAAGAARGATGFDASTGGHGRASPELGAPDALPGHVRGEVGASTTGGGGAEWGGRAVPIPPRAGGG